MKPTHLKESKADKVFHVFNTIILFGAMLLIALPLLNVIASSLSSPADVIAGRVTIWPVNFSTSAYKEIL